ncbi:hypothetical protein BC827DRAFT_554469 [Russula dissimulans]|nr:hypothetical protein BC827DRAFT_554469 [Russula dissimulans]
MLNFHPHSPAVQPAKTISQHSQRVTVSHVLVPRSYNPYCSFLHILDNDSLLNIIYYCRPILLNEEGPGDEDMILQEGEGHYGLWWYKLAHVCRRWRYLILASSSYLGLCLVCTHGTPVADMLAHSPPLPLIIDYVDEDCRVTAEDDKGILLALQHRDRVRRIRLRRPVPILQELVTAIDEEFPMLEYLYIKPQTKLDTSMTLPKTLQAPHLNRLILHNFAFPIGSPLLTTAAALVTLSLSSIPSNVLSLSVLLQRLSLLPQLESLKIGFHSPIPNRDVESQRLNVPITTHITLPNLRWFVFKGSAAYLEALLSRIAVPLLEKLQIVFFNQLVFSIPRLLQFTREAEGLKPRSARINFSPQGVFMGMYPSERTGADAFKFHMSVICKHLDWQLGCAAQIFNALSTVFPMVEDLSLECEGHRITPELYQDADRTVLRELLVSFGGLRTLRMNDGFVPLLTRSRQVDNGDSHIELVPELRELPYTVFKDPGGPCITRFSGCLVTHPSLRQTIHSPSQWPFRFYTIYPVLEDLFKKDFMRFNATTGTRLSEHDLEVEGREINLWALHKAVFLRNGYEAVTTNDEWAIIGVALGFPSFAGRDAGQPARCAPAVAHRLQKLYHDVLRHFDQAHITREISSRRALGALHVRRPSNEQLIAAKRWVDEQKRKAFSRDFDGVAGYPTIPESDIQECHRNLERLDQVLANIEKYIHVVFAVLKKEDVVHRMFTMMASSKVQLDELKKPKPRYVLELHTISGMIQEADNMDKGLKTVLGIRAQPQMMPPSGVPPTSQPPPRPPSAATPASFSQPGPPTVQIVPAALSRAPVPSLWPTHRKKPSRAAIPTPTPPPIPITSTLTLRASTPEFTAPSPQTPKSLKGKAAAKPKASVEIPSSAPSVLSVPSASTPGYANGGPKKAREDEIKSSTAFAIAPVATLEIETHRVPQHVIAFVEQNREHLQRAARDQNGFRISLTSKNQPFDNRPQINQPSALQGLPRPPQLIPGSQGLQYLQRQVLAQGSV